MHLTHVSTYKMCFYLQNKCFYLQNKCLLSPKKNVLLAAACPWNVEARHGYCYVLTANEFDYEAARDGCVTHGHGLLVWFEDAVELEWIIDIVEAHYLDSDKDIFIGRYTYIYVSLMNEAGQ